RHRAAQRILARRLHGLAEARRQALLVERRKAAEQAEWCARVEVERGERRLDGGHGARENCRRDGIALFGELEDLWREATEVARLGVDGELDHVLRIVAEDGEHGVGQRRGGPDAVMRQQRLLQQVAADAAATT